MGEKELKHAHNNAENTHTDAHTNTHRQFDNNIILKCLVFTYESITMKESILKEAFILAKNRKTKTLFSCQTLGWESTRIYLKKGIRNKLGIKLFHKRAQEYTWKMKNKGTFLKFVLHFPMQKSGLENLPKYPGNVVQRNRTEHVLVDGVPGTFENSHGWKECICQKTIVYFLKNTETRKHDLLELD